MKWNEINLFWETKIDECLKKLNSYIARPKDGATFDEFHGQFWFLINPLVKPVTQAPFRLFTNFFLIHIYIYIYVKTRICPIRKGHFYDFAENVELQISNLQNYKNAPFQPGKFWPFSMILYMIDFYATHICTLLNYVLNIFNQNLRREQVFTQYTK